jgi:hypothetical protein
MKKFIKLLSILILFINISYAQKTNKSVSFQREIITDSKAVNNSDPGQNYLGFTVIAAVVTTCGTILGLFIKDFLFVQYFETYRERKSLKAISQRYKDPILLTTTELVRRISELNNSYVDVSKGFTQLQLFNKAEKMQTSYANDPYFLKYKIVSTLYRFCALFGWLEMYRQDITFLNSHSKVESYRFIEIIGKIREAIADGQIIKEESDWQLWHDTLIFREELRAVGEGMIEITNNQKAILGYGKFQLLIDDYEFSKKPIWLRPVISFFTDFKFDKDFRTKRFKTLFNNLKELVECLDKDYYKEHVKGIK